MRPRPIDAATQVGVGRSPFVCKVCNLPGVRFADLFTITLGENLTIVSSVFSVLCLGNGNLELPGQAQTLLQFITGFAELFKKEDLIDRDFVVDRIQLKPFDPAGAPC